MVPVQPSGEPIVNWPFTSFPPRKKPCSVSSWLSQKHSCILNSLNTAEKQNYRKKYVFQQRKNIHTQIWSFYAWHKHTQHCTLMKKLTDHETHFVCFCLFRLITLTFTFNKNYKLCWEKISLSLLFVVLLNTMDSIWCTRSGSIYS